MIRVMIVEDDPMVAHINTEYINRVENFQVVKHVSNGMEALNYLKSGAKIDLIILDVYMPKMDGIKMLEELRLTYHEVDVIFVTAAKEKKIIQRGLQLGAVDYLIKPFTAERITAALEKYMSRYELFTLATDVNQSEIDRLFEKPSVQQLPKGIHPITLERIQTYLANSDEKVIDTHKMVKEFAFSMVTLRVYLDYLVTQNELEKETQYGNVGRPSYVYKKLK
ncbi:response regulator [Dielma fastidiosa]|uniref:Transcriptional regulatory protein n=1 Tax=Dielma fastidiosa TaxID=1034346 RepID=A0A318KNT6_9FIRM|nr:response regulator [Dielma fastidiosa]PXX79704.1 two-component system CitB family response regulator/two-component system response regulator DctR [Dielma fastidiosa]